MKRYISKSYSKLYKTLKVELFPKIKTAELNYGPFHILKNEKPLPPRSFRLFASCLSSNDASSKSSNDASSKSSNDASSKSSNDYKLASNQPDILDNLKKLLEDYMKFKAEDFLVEYLNKNANLLSRISLRYSIEKFSDEERKFFLSIGKDI